MDTATQEELIRRATERGYLEVRDGRRVAYHCHRQHEDNWADPEEKVRAAVFAWLILEREYPANRIEIEVTVPRRIPSDYADIVVYEDDACRAPYLVVETKPRGIPQRDVDQAVEQAFGNANSVRAKYALYDNADGSRLYDVANFPSTERLSNYLGPRGALGSDYGRAKSFRLTAGEAPGSEDIGPVTTRDLETAIRQAHALIWSGGARDPLMAFQEWCKLLFAKVYDERWTPNGQPRRFQVGAGENEVSVGNRIRTLYADAQRQDPTIWLDPIQLPDSKIRQVVLAIQHIGLLMMDIDALGAAFERFFSTIFRGGLGQYFTQRELVRFIVALLQPTEADIVLDPTAGSGGFLLETLVQVWHGIDRRYAGRRDIDRLKNDFALNHLFGIELHDVAGRVCQTNLLLHQDGHTNVEVGRSCLDTQFVNPEIRLGHFSLVVGNPPFGDDVREGDTDRLGHAHLSDFELATGSQIDSELVILERAVAFLEAGGRLGMVVPDGVLNNSSEGSGCPALRRFLLKNCRILAIISLPDYAFRKAGAQNKTSLLFCQRFTAAEEQQFHTVYDPEVRRLTGTVSEVEAQVGALRAALVTNDHTVFLGEAEWIGYAPAGTPIDKNELYHLSNQAPDLSDQTTLLGQYMRFWQDPSTYAGASRPACLAISASELFNAHPTHRMDPKYHLFKQREAFASLPAGMARHRLGGHDGVLIRQTSTVIPFDHPDQEFVTLTLTQEGGLEPREAGKGINPIDWHGAYFKEGARWYRAHTDDLIISRIDVWKGCVAIIPEEFDGAIVTQEFPLYKVRQDKLRPYYLKLLLRTEYFQRAIRAITTGHSNRRRTQDDDFDALEIFLPPVDVQDRIVSLVQQRERAIRDDVRNFDRLIDEVERCVMGDISADELLDRETGATTP